MMWLIFTLLVVAVLAFLIGPLFLPALGRGRLAATEGIARADYDFEIYRRQLSEVDGDAERGVLTAEAAEAARLEIKRRLLRAGDEGAAEASRGGRPGLSVSRLATAGALVVLVPLAAVPLYLHLGAPVVPDQPFAARQADRQQAVAEQQQDLDMGRLIDRLRQRLDQSPDDVGGWLLLARSYQSQQRFDEAAKAYGRAAALTPGDADIQVGIGESLTFAADGTITPAAQAAFARALELDPQNPAARYYAALERAQVDDWQGAYDRWLALAKDTPADAPWRPALLEQLEVAAGKLGVDLAKALPPPAMSTAPAMSAAPPASMAVPPAAAPGPSRDDVAAAQQMAPEDRQQMIRTMVERLAGRLRENPADFDGWMRLGRAYRVLGDLPKAAEAYGRAAEQRPNDVDALMNQAAALIESGGAERPLPAAVTSIFRRVLALDPANADALWFGGRAAAEAGDAAAARDLWTRLLASLDKASPQYATVKTSLDALPASK